MDKMTEIRHALPQGSPLRKYPYQLVELFGLLAR